MSGDPIEKREEWEGVLQEAFGPASVGPSGSGREEEPPHKATPFRFTIGPELARDSASILHLARDREVDRDVTLRVLGGEGNGDETAVRRFLEEAQVGAQLQHPAILPVYGLGLLEDGRAYVASRIVEGETLAQHMESEANPERLLSILEQAAHALAYAHARGVAHGTLDASRIHLGTHGEVVISGWERAVRASWDAHRIEADVNVLRAMLADTLGEKLDGNLNSAGAVARGIGRHLSGQEARVREEEVEAATARLKAERERENAVRTERQARKERAARHRTLAVAGAVLLVAAVGIGAFLWRKGASEAERGRIEAQVTAALREAERFEAAGDWAEARAWAKNALALGSGANQQAEELIARVDKRVRTAAEDAVLRSRLAEIQAARDLLKFSLATRTASYESVLRDHGLDLLAMEPDAAAEAIRSRAIRADIVRAVQAWALRLLESLSEDARHLRDIICLADPQPWRREFWYPTDDAAFRRVAAKADLGTVHPDTIRDFIRLIPANEHDLAEAIYLEARRRHPSDTALTMSGAQWLYRNAQDDPREASSVLLCALAVSPEDPGVLLLYGVFQSVLGELRIALPVLKKAVKLDPDYGTAFVALGRVMRRMGLSEDALPVLARAIELDPDDGSAHAILGCVLGRLGRLEEARTHLERASELATDSWVVHVDLGEALRETGDLDRALVHLRKAVELSPDSAFAHSQLGGCLLDDFGDVEGGIANLKRATELSPGHPGYHANLGCGYLRGGRFPKAAAEFRRALELDPVNVDAHRGLGGALLGLGRPREAAKALRRAIERSLPPGDLTAHLADSWADLGRSLMDCGEWDEALAAVEKALEIDPNHGFAHLVLGYILTARKDFEGAASALRRVLEIAPGHLYAAGAHAQLGWLLAEHFRDPVGAVRHFRAAVARAPGNPNLRVNLGSALAGSGELSDAAAEFRAALQLDPKCVGAFVGLGHVSQLQGKAEDAERAFRFALRLDARDPYACGNLAWLLAVSEEASEADLKEALGLAERAVREGPENRRCRGLGVLGLTRYRLGRYEEALRALEECVRGLGSDRLPGVEIILAMTLWKLDRKEEARAALDRDPGPDDETRGVAEEAYRRLRAEAEALMKKE